MNGGDARADRHALLELDALLVRIEALAADGDRQKFETDDEFRWVLHRLWIAVGNEALAYTRLTGLDPHVDQPWARLYQPRNKLAHRRLPDIDLPAGTKAALRARAKRRHRSVEAEARNVLTRATEGEPVTIVDLLGTDEGADIEFEPERLGLTARSAPL